MEVQTIVIGAGGDGGRKWSQEIKTPQQKLADHHKRLTVAWYIDMTVTAVLLCIGIAYLFT